MPARQPTSPPPQSLPDATCLGCGCLCDDITLHVQAGRITRAERACPVGERWFLAERPADAPICTIAGQSADLSAGCKEAAKILSQGRIPLVFGLAGATCEAQRVAVAIADRVGAVVDAAPESAALSAAVQSVGMVTATLGEVRHRADLVIFWGVDPATTHPRHFERYSLTCTGQFVPRGRADRTCVVIDHRRTPTADTADLFVQIKPGSDGIAIELLTALAAGDANLDEAEVMQKTGVALADWRALTDRMTSARYGALFFDPRTCGLGSAGATRDEALAEPSAPAPVIASLLTLVRDMNRHTRFVALPLGSPANAAGAGQVLTWQTGFPTAVSFAADYPQYDATEHSAAATLARGKADAALVVAGDSLIDPISSLPAPAREQLGQLPCIVLHSADMPPPGDAAVTFTVATPGIQAGGTVFRSDGVALPLRAAIVSPYPSAEAVLQLVHDLLLAY